MRARYWSHSKLADSIRKMFSLPPNPVSATMEEWDTHHKIEHETSKLGITLVDSLDTLQRIVYWIPDTAKTIVYKIDNALSGNHVMRTTAKLGDWSDLATKIPDALMYAIIDFVEKECFWMDIAFFEPAELENVSDAVYAYANQSYIMRKLFPVKVSDSERAHHGLKYLQFQIDAAPIKENPYTELIEAYKFAKNVYFKFDAFEESGYNDYEMLHPSTGFRILGPERRTYFTKVRELEEAHEAQVIKHCTSIIKYHEYLWT